MKNRSTIFRFIFFILLVLAAIELLNAQSSATSFRIGYNSSTVWTNRSDLPVRKNLPGIYLGAAYKYSFTPVELQGEMLISTKGFMAQSVGETYIHNLILYLEMPFCIKKKVIETAHMNIFLSGGLTFMCRILAINLISEIEGIRRFDQGINFGMGIQFGKIALEARYTQSFINMDLIEGPGYNQTFSAGMNFYFKGR